MVKRLAPIALLLLAACQAPVTLDTPSGFPEVTIRATPQKVRDFMASEMLPFWTVKTSNEYQWTVGIPERSAAAGFLYGSAAAPTPEQRRTYSFMAAPDGTKVSARAWLVSNPGTGMERLTEFGRGSQINADIQRALERVKVILER